MRAKQTKSIARFLMLFVLCACIAMMAACGPKDEGGNDPVFTLDKTSIELTVDENVEVLTLTIANVEETPEWTSSNPQVATVTVGTTANKATVRGVAEGNAVISVTAGSNIAVCTVKVNPGTHLDLVTKSLNLFEGTTGTISVDTDITSLTYTSDNTSVATVNQSGVVTGVSAGTANITVSGGNKSVVCPVTVIGPSVAITNPANADYVIQLTLQDGENTYQLEAESNGTVTWGIGNASVATVSDDGLVTAVAKGETTVTASYGTAQDTRTVKVKEEIITVALSETEHTLEAKDSFTLTATVTPEQTGDDAGVTWSVVSGGDLVSVDENGLVTSLGDIYGTAVIRATSVKDTDSYAECTVTVPDPYGDWIKISDKETLIAALAEANEEKNMYLTGDIDLEGATIDSKLNAYKGIFDGRGYEIMNYSGKLCHALFGTIQNLAITCDASAIQEHFGAVCHHVEGSGKIENCIIDITFDNGGWRNGIGCYSAGTVSNTIILARNPSGTGNVFATTEQNNAAAKWNNVFFTAYGNVGNVGATAKTEEQLKTAATFDGWDTTIWQIEDGSVPTLKNGGNIGEVKVSLNETELTLHKDDAFTLVATVKPAKLPSADKAVTWESSDNTVVSVEDGVITALKEGTATITATSVKDPTKSVTCEVTVDGATVIDLTSEASLTLEINATSKINATVNQGGLIYTSSAPEVATVDENGNITAVAAGDAVITVRSDESAGKFVSVNVKVMPEVEISIDGEAEFDMEIGATHELTLITNRPDDNGVWTSSDPEVAAVEDGTITALKDGRVTVTYTSAVNNKKYVSVKVNVQPEITLSVVSSLTIKTNTETDLGAVVSRGGLTYVSSNEEAVTVTEDGKVTGLIDGGTATITVTSVIDPSKTATCEITVSDDVEVTISLDKQTATLDWDATLTLTATVNVPGVEWSSSDDSIATVENGVVTALRKDGEVTITATSTEDNTKTATCVITVEYVNPVITINRPTEEEVVLEIGEEQVVEYEVSKGEGSIVIDGENGILSLNNNVLTARAAGTVTVKVVCTETDLTFEETFTVTVKPAPSVEITNKSTAAEGIKVGEGLTLTATANREDGTLSWASSDEAIATIDENGVITTSSEGDVTITVTFTTASGLTATDKVTITVYDGAILELALEARSVSVGGTWKIDYKAAGGAVEWTSSNPGFATVENGVVTGVAVGKTTITASVAGTDKTASMVISVYEKAAGAVEVSTAAQFQAMGSGTYYVVNDIDFGGETVNTLSEWVKVDGLGYKISNFKTPKLFSQFQGYMRNVEISCILNGNGNFDGLFGTWIGAADGTVENCIFDITFSGNANQCALVHHNNNGKVNNVLIKVTREAGANGEKFPAWFEKPNNGKVSNIFLIKESGSFSAVNGATEKTEAQLKQASTFDESWDNGWVIIDGELPVLKGALVTEPLKVKLDKTTDEIYVGEQTTITAIVTPSELTDEERAVTWSSDNEEVATVADGVVTALKAGTAVITATSADGTKSASCTVTVNAITLTINEEDKISELKLNGTKQLNATVNRGDYEWSTSDSAVATVEDGLVTAVGAGSVTITVTSKLDPMVSDSITIEVKATVEITVTLDKTELALDRGATATLTATVVNSDNGVTWTSSDESVATVDENGVVTTLGKDGTATITATSKDDNGEGVYATATCEITVEYVKEEITVENTELLIPVGGALTVSDIATATKGEFALALKDGSEEGIVNVEAGKITAIKSGEVTVVLTWSIAYDDVEDDVRELIVTVFAPTVELNIDTAKRTLKVGENSAARVLHVTMDNMPAEPNADDVVWTSSNTGVIDTVTAGYDGSAYTGTLNAAGEGVAVITASYTVEGIEYKITCEVAVFTAAGTWTAVYNASTFKNIGASNYYITNDIDMEGATVTGWNENAKINGMGYTVSNFVTPKLVSGEAFGGEMRNLKLSCGIGEGIGGHGLFGLYTTGSATIENCIFEVDFTAAPVKSVLAHHAVNGCKVKNVIILISNTIGDGGNAPGFYITDGGLQGTISAGNIQNTYYMVKSGFRAGAAYGVTLKTEAQLKTADTFDESWNEQWVITDGEMPVLKLAGFPEEHRHTFSKEWSTDAENHWHAATCGDIDEKKDLGAHDENGPDGECSVCGYFPPDKHRHTYAEEWQSDETNHWKVTVCEDHDEEQGLLEAHNTNGPQKSCTVCGYIAPLSYDLGFSPENGMPSDAWVYWKGDDATEAAKTISGHYENRTLTVTFSENSGEWWGTQLFYKDSKVSYGAAATIKMTITSTVSGHIQINGQSVELKADDAYEFTCKGANNALISVQMGANGSGVDIEAATITFANITITK